VSASPPCCDPYPSAYLLQAPALFGPCLLADLVTTPAEDSSLQKKLNGFLLFHEHHQFTERSGKLRRKGRGLHSWEWLRCEGRSKKREGGNMSMLKPSLSL